MKSPSKNSTSASGVASREINNNDKALSGGKSTVKMGPAAKHRAGNPTHSGGINRPAKGRSS